MSFKNYRDESRSQWGAHQETSLTIEQLMLGATLRIADATELMAKNVVQLQDDRDRYKRWHGEEKALRQSAERRITALRGVITRLQNAASKVAPDAEVSA